MESVQNETGSDIPSHHRNGADLFLPYLLTHLESFHHLRHISHLTFNALSVILCMFLFLQLLEKWCRDRTHLLNSYYNRVYHLPQSLCPFTHSFSVPLFTSPVPPHQLFSTPPFLFSLLSWNWLISHEFLGMRSLVMGSMINFKKIKNKKRFLNNPQWKYP